MAASQTFDAVRDLPRAERSALTHRLLLEAAAVEGDERGEILDRVVVLNLRVAHAIAARYRNRGVPLADLEQAASVGLVKAVAGFDPALRHDLLTYAVPTMRGEVQRYFRDVSWTIRPPRPVQDLQWRVNRAVEELSREQGREPTADELCLRLDVSRETYDEAVAAFGCLQPTSLDQPVRAREGSLTVGDAIADDADTDSPVEARVMLSPLVRSLSARDRRLLHLRFVEDRTQRDIGVEMGVQQMQVSRWLSRIYDELRASLGDDGLRARQAS